MVRQVCSRAARIPAAEAWRWAAECRLWVASRWRRSRARRRVAVPPRGDRDGSGGRVVRVKPTDSKSGQPVKLTAKREEWVQVSTYFTAASGEVHTSRL